MILYLLLQDHPIFLVLAGVHIALSFVFSFVLKSSREDPQEGNYAKLDWSYLSYILLFLAYMLAPIYLMEIGFIWQKKFYLTSGWKDTTLESRMRELKYEIDREKSKESILVGIAYLIQADELSARQFDRCEQDLENIRTFFNSVCSEYGYSKLTKSSLQNFVELMKKQKKINKG
ncbi:MAG: hypothetical protein HWE39_24275 [Oceanospirillaceae bacterium]|nr:hypothetical protein [Oceanospirillaceae bacterium]